MTSSHVKPMDEQIPKLSITKHYFIIKIIAINNNKPVNIYNHKKRTK